MTKVNRFKRSLPCPICGGFKEAEHGKGERCWGFSSDDEKWANCTREEYAGSLPFNPSTQTYGHYLGGDCRCGARHSPGQVTKNDTNGNSDGRYIVSTYDYKDEDGNIVYQVVRYSDKNFFQRKPDGNGGWIWSLDGVDRVPYRLQEWLHARLKGENLIFIAEGEKDVDRLRELGLNATCNSEGAGKWIPAFKKYFEGAEVVVLADNDEAGRKHVNQVAINLLPVAASVKVIELPGLQEKGDVSDWLDAGNTVDNLKEIVSDHPIYSMNRNDSFPVLTAKQIGALTPERPEWECVGIAARGSVTEVVGKAKLAGKTTLIMQMIKASQSGCSFLGLRTRKFRILFLTEERYGSFRESLNRNGLLDCDDMYAISYYQIDRSLSWPECIETATSYAKAAGITVLVVDTISHWAGLRGDAENQSGASLEAMMPLQYAAAQGLAVIVLRHGNKSGGEIGDAGRGSSAITGAVDISFLLTRTAAGDSSAKRRELKGLGRFDATPDHMIIEMVDGEYKLLGDTADAQRVDARKQIREHLPSSVDEAVSESDLAKKVGDTKLESTLKRELRKMLEEGLVGRLGNGVRNDAYRYYQTSENVSDHTNKGMNRNEFDDSEQPSADEDSPNDTEEPWELNL